MCVFAMVRQWMFHKLKEVHQLDLRERDRGDPRNCFGYASASDVSQIKFFKAGIIPFNCQRSATSWIISLYCVSFQQWISQLINPRKMGVLRKDSLPMKPQQYPTRKLLIFRGERTYAALPPEESWLGDDSKISKMVKLTPDEQFGALVYESFDAMGLPEKLLRGIYAYGFEKPLPIQQRGIVPFTKGLDVIEQGQPGTGKTATFCCGILQQLDYGLEECQALVLAPTHELARQIEKVMQALGDFSGVKVLACTSGTSVLEDQQTLSGGVHVVVGTPGRVLDLLSRKKLLPDHIKMCVLDEADLMLSASFKDQVYNILELIPNKPQLGLFSDTQLPKAVEITKKFLNKPVKVVVKPDCKVIKQFDLGVRKDKFKFNKLTDLYASDFTRTKIKSIIFVNSCETADWVTDKMRKKGLIVSVTHENMDQSTRDSNMHEFRSGSSRVLITTDLVARGIDIKQVSLVIGYDFPIPPENYQRRIACSDRFAITFTTTNDGYMRSVLEKHYAVVFEKFPENLFNLL